MNGQKPVTAVVVGMGARAAIYAREALRHPEQLTIVGVADVNPEHVRYARETFSIPPERCFASAEALAAVPKFADAAINGTMDPQHVETTLPLLHRGYDVLLEKPVATNREDADRLLACARETGRKVMVCHVLRYAPFYKKLKETVLSGELGRIINIQMTEQVSYFHESVSYVRGKYASPEVCGSGMLLSKCSHDMDLMAWLMAQSLPKPCRASGRFSSLSRRRHPRARARIACWIVPWKGIACIRRESCIWSILSAGPTTSGTTAETTTRPTRKNNASSPRRITRTAAASTAAG